MTDEERKLTRRRFLNHAAVAGASTALTAGVALKTDALARPAFQAFAVRENGMGAMPYPYMNP